MWTRTGGEEPPRLVRSPERIHCPSGTRIDRRQVYPPRNPFYSLSKSVSCRKNDPAESASTFCRDSTMLSSLLLIRSHYYAIVDAVTGRNWRTTIEYPNREDSYRYFRLIQRKYVNDKTYKRNVPLICILNTVIKITPLVASSTFFRYWTSKKLLLRLTQTSVLIVSDGYPQILYYPPKI